MYLVILAILCAAIAFLVWLIDKQPEEELYKMRWHAVAGLTHILMLAAALVGLFGCFGSSP